MHIEKSLYILLTAGMMSCATVKQEVQAPQGEDKEEQAVVSVETDLSENDRNELEYLFIEGLKQKKLGKLNEAAALLARCLEIDPNSSVAMYEMAQIHLANKDVTSASLVLEKAVSLDPSNIWYQELLAQIYQQRKQFSEAAAIYASLRRSDPENDEYLFMQAGSLAMAGQYEAAIAAYNELEAKVGINDQLSVAKQQVYLSWKKPEEALKEINRLIASDPEEPSYYGILAEYYQAQGNKEMTLQSYQKILDLDPDNGFVHFSLAGFYQEQGNFEKAFSHIKQAFTNDEIDADTKIQYYLMQTANKESTDWTNAQISELLDILHNKYPDNPLMYTVYADHMIRQNKLPEAREYLRKYIREDRENFVIWQQLLFISNDLHDFESLYQDSKEAMQYFPDQAVIYALNAVAALQLEKYEEALQVLEKGETHLQQGNEHMQIQFEIYKAEANYKLDRVQEAFRAFDEVIRLDPDNFMAMNNYAYYLSLRGENLDKAEHLSSRVVQANPNNPTYLDTHAWVLFKKKNYSEAKAYMETALENGGNDNATLIEHYGDILFMMGDKAKAMENWKKAKAIGDGSDVLEQKIKESRYIESKQP